jgi:amino acid transporter
MSVDAEAPSTEAEQAGPPSAKPVQFGTFTGVFTPTLLTIFGVIMYVRVGWAVGNAGLAGTWMVMALGIGITACTALSLSSIATNVRVGPGGPYAIMTRSLGFEVGGSIGVPLYLTRPLGVAMYVIGFREGWLWIFPHHPPLIVDIVVFIVLAGISYLSANLAFRVQFLIMAVIVGSLLSIFLSPVTFNAESSITWWGDYRGFPENGFASNTDFWGVFAVFFPATTGILAGANMSGDLKDPRRAIPAGTLWALLISSIVYFAIAYWCTRAADPKTLTENYNLIIDKALWPPIVLAGLLGATASSALAGLVGGPRILMAMGQNKIIPFSDAMARTSKDGNPRISILVTAVITLAFIMVRDLNAIAPLVTMFFLITYGMLNVVVLVEASLGLVSFRPTLKISRVVPLIGLLGCLFSMFIVNPTFGLISVGLVVAFYFYMQRRVKNLQTNDVRSSVFVAVAQWAASRITDEDHENARAWKPNLLVPVYDDERVRGQFPLLIDLTKPDGSLTLLGIEDDLPGAARLRTRLTALAEDLREHRVQASAAVLKMDDLRSGVLAALESLQAAFFRPNVLLMTLEPDSEDEIPSVPALVEAAAHVRVGMILVGMHPKAVLGERKRVHMWVRSAPGSWDAKAAFSSGNLNLNLLTGYRLMREWNAELTVHTVVRSESEVAAAQGFLSELFDLARLPKAAKTKVCVGDFETCLDEEPVADINLIGLPANREAAYFERLIGISRSTCLFVWDSGRENALV